MPAESRLPSQQAGCEAASANNMSIQPRSFMVHLLIDFVNRRTPPLVVHDHTSLQSALPQRAVAGYSWCEQDKRYVGLLGKIWKKGLPCQKGCSKIFFRIYVLREHNPRVAIAVAALFVYLGDMSGNHVSLLSWWWLCFWVLKPAKPKNRLSAKTGIDWTEKSQQNARFLFLQSNYAISFPVLNCLFSPCE